MAKADNIPSIYELLREALEQEELVDIKYVEDLRAVIASVGGKRVGALRVKPFKEGYQVDTVSVSPDYRKLGIGTEMYRVAFEALNSLYSDKYQTPAAKRIWDSLISSGEAEKVGERYKMAKLVTTLQEATSNRNGVVEQFAETREKGAEKIADNAKEKGGLALLTWHHFKVKLPYYKKAAEGKLDFEKAKKEYQDTYKKISLDMTQIEFQREVGRLEVLGELLIKNK